VNQLLFDGLTVLQHRGQDAAGMVTSEQCRLHLRKDNGLVKDVFQSHHMRELRGNVGLGHCRYPTAGSSSCAEAQPLYTNYPHGICVAHNGNLVNTESLTKQLVRTGRHVNTDSDSEVLLNIFAQNLMKQLHSNSADSTTFGNDKGDMIQAIFDAATVVMRECTGGYAALYLINGFGLVALRDPHGIRPLVYGTRMSPPVNDPRIVPGGRGRSMSFSQSTMIDYCIASESVAIDTLGFQLERYVPSLHCSFHYIFKKHTPTFFHSHA
jgi:amidophosphoribosyltransferase